jgi:hypothetical protein
MDQQLSASFVLVTQRGFFFVDRGRFRFSVATRLQAKKSLKIKK